MFLRLLIFVVAAVLVYRAAKKWFGPDRSLEFRRYRDAAPIGGRRDDPRSGMWHLFPTA
jgi:hypothetical protein